MYLDDDIGENFDPLKILELSAGGDFNIKFLEKLKNLRILVLYEF